MRVKLRLSSKKNSKGYNEILLMVRTKKLKSYAKSGISIDAAYFVNGDIDHDTLHRKRLITPDVAYHQRQEKELSNLINHIENNLNERELTKEWLSNIVDSYWHRNQDALLASPITKEEAFNSLVDEYFAHLEGERVCDGTLRHYRVMFRTLHRFVGFKKATKDEKYVFDIDTFTKDDVEDFRNYMHKEKALSDVYPTLFAQLLSDYPVSIKDGRNVIIGRGGNTIVRRLKCLRAFYTWLNKNGRSQNNPFFGFDKWQKQIYGPPNYITIDEREKIANTPMPSIHLERQRDIFIFQSLVGCRVGDLMNLTEQNISGVENKILSYIPHKTKNEREHSIAVRVPLIDEAVALIEKYNGVDGKGRLFPFISQQRYNDAIKEIFTIAGITRPVLVHNPITDEMEPKPINTIATSHMARKTFIGNLYFHVQDPNLIGKMSGHAEGSRAFSVYRNIEDETLNSVIQHLKLTK